MTREWDSSTQSAANALGVGDERPHAEHDVDGGAGDEGDGGEYGVGVNAEVASRVQEEDVLELGAHSVVSSKWVKDH